MEATQAIGHVCRDNWNTERHCAACRVAKRAGLEPTRTAPDLAARFPILMSYAYMRKAKEEVVAWLLKNPHVEFLIDSGGFSALNMGEEIPLGEYCDWLHRWKEDLFGYVHLDKLGDPQASEANLKVMLDAGLKPVPVHVRGDGQERMDELFTLSDWVALGGFRRPHKGWCKPNYIKQKMRWARGRNVHWLGYTRADMLLGFLPYSCDSTNMSAGTIWGQLAIYLGDLRWHTQRKWPYWSTQPLTPALHRILDRCGFTFADFRNKRLWRTSKGVPMERRLLQELSFVSWVDYVRDLRRLTGIRYFQAQSPQVNTMARLFHWIDATLPDGLEPYGTLPPSGAK